MVFVFYQFQPAPLHFNPQTEQRLRGTDQAEPFAQLQEKNKQTQEAITALLLTEDFTSNTTTQNTYKKYSQENRTQRAGQNKIEQNPSHRERLVRVWKER